MLAVFLFHSFYRTREYFVSSYFFFQYISISINSVLHLQSTKLHTPLPKNTGNVFTEVSCSGMVISRRGRPYASAIGPQPLDCFLLPVLPVCCAVHMYVSALSDMIGALQSMCWKIGKAHVRGYDIRSTS